MTAAPTPTLPSRPWKTSFRHEDGDLLALFYVPALECAVAYDRMTGYFTADALALAARGIERLIANDGRMRLIVGCTLDDDEAEAIEQGYDLRAVVARSLVKIALEPPDMAAKGGLSALAWLVARGRLDVKVAVPVGADGRPTPGTGIYHEKVGVLTDAEGNRISFSGSINETRGGWVNNRESFHVHCSWEGGREAAHVADEVAAFERLWEDKAHSVKVLDFPDAARDEVLKFLPSDDRIVTAAGPQPFRLASAPAVPAPKFEWPARTSATSVSATTTGPPAPASEKPGQAPVEPEPAVADPEPPHRLLPEEVRRVVWAFIRNAARMPNGALVGAETSAVTPWPHQLHTFARMYRGWPCRLLIADEVGLGKTISAGLLLRQAWLSGRARRILLMVPAAVLPQWRDELYEKFNLDMPIYDGQRLCWRSTHARGGPRERKVGRDEWHGEPFVLCSSQLMRRRDRAEELLRAEPWDLVVLDEAHHARRKAPGSPQEGGPNRLLRLMQGLRDRARSLVLLTATPMQVHPVEVWDLLNLLGLPRRWAASTEEFARYFRLASGNPSQAELEFLAEMFRATEAEFGSADESEVARTIPAVGALTRERVLKALRDGSGIPLKRLDGPARAAALDVLRRFSPIRFRMSRHTRALLRRYHAQGKLDAPIATRDVRDVPIALTPSERELYEAVEDYITTTYANASQGEKSAVGFVMTIYRRRLASSFQALKQTLVKRLAGEDLDSGDEDVSQDEQAEEVMDAEEAAEEARRALVAEERESIQDLLKRIARLGTDTKARRLREEIERAFADGYGSVIAFTQYVDTMVYLREYLAAELPGVPVATYSGRGGETRDAGGYWCACSKERLKQGLRDGSVRLLICTDAGAEGLNFQTCGVVINVDLPWNPMRVEQRIGRIDRIGQVYPTIRVVNLAYEDTVEADVYFALQRRIGLFEGIVGRLQPILSRLPKEFERATLERPGDRAAARQRLVAEVEAQVAEADSGGLDVDEAAEALDPPDLPAPSLTQEGLDAALNRPDVRPPGAEWERLDRGSYALRLPGSTAKVRVTTSAAVFDDHPDSHEFLSPGGALLDSLAGPPDDGDSVADASVGNFWLVESPDGDGCREVVVTGPSGPMPVTTLSALTDILASPPRPTRHPNPAAGPAVVRRLA